VPTITTIFQRGWGVDYDWIADRAVSLLQPNQLATLNFPPGFQSDLEGALRGQGDFSDFTYVFRNGQYQKVQHATMSPDGQPRATAGPWGLPGRYTNLDAVFPGSGKKSQFAYFFRGNEYVRFDWTTDKSSPNYPKKIGPNWHTAAPFDQDIDGVVIGVAGFATKAYLFKTIDVTVDDKGDPAPTGAPDAWVVPVPAYARYDFDGEKVDFTETNPAQVVRAWPGLFPLLDAGQALDIARDWVFAAIGALTGALSPNTLNAFGHHFMTNSPTTSTVTTVRNRFVELQTRLNAHPDKFQWTPGLGIAAQTRQGLLTEIGDNFSITHGPNGRAAVLIHEAVHFTFGGNVDVPEWSGQTVNGRFFAPNQGMPVYSTISTNDAIINPSSYAAFSQEVHFGVDARFGRARPHE
jgi:hypothetical protein